MATDIPTIALESVELDVIGKFEQLTRAALGTRSFFMRAKDTFRSLFLNEDTGAKKFENDYAKMASELIGKTASDTTHAMMQLALEWAKEEKELAYSLTKIRVDMELVAAQRAEISANIDKINEETKLTKAKIIAEISSSIRDNGRVMSSDLNGFPTELHDEGFKYSQIGSQRASTYATLADAYRKSGVVELSITSDGQLKGISGDDAGYTVAQEKFAIRQTVSFEDSKRNHAANASSSMIGQMLSAEVPPAAEDVVRWRTSIDYLNSDTPNP